MRTQSMEAFTPLSLLSGAFDHSGPGSIEMSFLARIVEGKTTEQIAAAIVALPEKERLVLALYYFEELTKEEIGLALGLLCSEVSDILSSALMQLWLLLDSAY